jgi:carboxymethylenebutenolidase
VYEGQLAETVRYPGFQGDEIEAYFGRPLTQQQYPGVVVIHHMPGWDEWTREVVRKFAHHGYAAVSPNLFSREGPGSIDDVVAKVRAAGGTPDDRCVGDVEGSVRYLRALPYMNGKVGVIGFCSGGRQAYLVACTLSNIDATVDCWGGRVIAGPDTLTPRQPVAPIDLTKNLGCPLLGLFGNEDTSPSPDQVNATEAELKKFGKTYEFHRYDNAGHGFFDVARPSYRPTAAVEGWKQVFNWFAKYLNGPAG